MNLHDDAECATIERSDSKGDDSWGRFRGARFSAQAIPVVLDLSGVAARVSLEDSMRTVRAAKAMRALERGAIANPEESRMVGHYWLRAPGIAPTEEIARDIRDSVDQICKFVSDIASGVVKAPAGSFLDVLHVGIGGSAVGPQFVCGAQPDGVGSVRVHFLDNSDPAGVDRVLTRLKGGLDRTLVYVVSKSGHTPTPMAVLREIEERYAAAGLDLASFAVATTMSGSPLDERAIRERWLHRFPLWDWVGGRTSVTSAVGLLPGALLGMDIRAFLDGAAAMDAWTRHDEIKRNPALALALAWYCIGGGRGERNMVVLPYSDRLSGLPKWLQQLVMESIGKRLDRAGAVVEQGMTVYGNKGSSDQHAYMQQLRDGPADFFLNFVQVQRDRKGLDVELTPNITLGDHLFANLEGTRGALEERGRFTITTTVRDSGPSSLGALIALYERAVGLYAELIDVNAYHQPAVDKYAARAVLDLQLDVLDAVAWASRPKTAPEIAEAMGREDASARVFRLLEHLAADGRVARSGGPEPDQTFWGALAAGNDA